MKIRTGFVSNSSSSSFIVKIREPYPDLHADEEDKFLANAEDIKKLEEYGFIKTTVHNPFDYKNKAEIDNELDDDDEEDYLWQMGYYVSCNQNDVIYFLVKNNIPFKASCHYGHEYVGYQKDSDHIIEAFNFGSYLCMYEDNDTDTLEKYRKAIKKIPKEKYFDEQDEISEKLKKLDEEGYFLKKEG